MIRPRFAALALVLLASTARAEPSAADRALATELFKQGRTLMAAGKHEQACPKLEESQRLDPGGGTLLNVALCHQAVGRTATAWSELNEALSLARRDARSDREALAQKHIAALEPKLSRLTIVVPPDADVPELRVARDGTEVARVAWGTAMPVNPGMHELEVTAPGKLAWKTSVDVGPDADSRTVSVAALALDPAAAAPPPEAPPPAPVAAPSPAPGPAPAPVVTPRHAQPPPKADSKVLPIAILGVGIVGLGVGSYFGLRAFSKHSDAKTEGASLDAEAGKAADISTVAFAVGLVGVGVGGYLLLSAGPEPDGPAQGSIGYAARW